MSLLFCSILIIFPGGQGAGNTLQSVVIEGRVLKEDAKTYTMDFSRVANLIDGIGNYSKVVVNKQDCIEAE